MTTLDPAIFSVGISDSKFYTQNFGTVTDLYEQFCITVNVEQANNTKITNVFPFKCNNYSGSFTGTLTDGALAGRILDFDLVELANIPNNGTYATPLCPITAGSTYYMEITFAPNDQFTGATPLFRGGISKTLKVDDFFQNGFIPRPTPPSGLVLTTDNVGRLTATFTNFPCVLDEPIDLGNAGYCIAATDFTVTSSDITMFATGSLPVTPPFDVALTLVPKRTAAFTGTVVFSASDVGNTQSIPAAVFDNNAKYEPVITREITSFRTLSAADVEMGEQRVPKDYAVEINESIKRKRI